MKYLSLFFLLLIISAQPARSQEIRLVVGSWRTEDVEQMTTLLARFNATHPGLHAVYDPTPATEYDTALRAQLQEGGGPDIMLLRSYCVSRSLFADGYLEPLNSLPGLADNFTAEALTPWSSKGTVYGVPLIATSHAIYYNKDIFRRQGLSVPATWEQLLRTAEELRTAGLTAFANASGDPWTLNELILCSIAPNFLGGTQGRRAYLNGSRCFNDEHMIALFQAVADLQPFLPANQASLTYQDSRQIFSQGQAAMWFGGSWELAYLEKHIPDFDWSVFAPPPPTGAPACLTFHRDAGLGLNAASPHKAEARRLLAWMATPDFGQQMSTLLPGFFPMHITPPQLRDSHASAFLALNQGRETDIRFTWEALRSGTPSAYDLAENATLAVISGTMTPREAADSMQAGLSTWYTPARNCTCN